jgi:RNA polymerase sigma-54 factor
MNYSWRPIAQQAQTTTLSAQIIQSIRLLQLTRDELETFISEQCEKNPLIELARPAQSAEDRSMAQGVGGRPVPLGSGPRAQATSPAHDADRMSHDLVAERPSLREHLLHQLGSSTFRDPGIRRLAIEIIESLGDDGYLQRDLRSIASAVGFSQADAAAALSFVQELDPAGIAARDLRECLRLQLRDRDQLTASMESLLDHLPLLAKHAYAQLAGICRAELGELMGLVRQIRALDPRPGRRFDADPIIPAVPDVTVTVDQSGVLITTLNAHGLPRVLVDREYYSKIRTGCRGVNETRFVSDCLREANWLVRNLEHRADTILKVATEIVIQQQEFFFHGIERLKPLTLKQVADAIGVHQSTVCRTISNKFMMTPNGLFELKFFFANSIPATNGSDHSTDTVRHRIKQLLNLESDKVLSDEAIVKALKREGVEIARRTVAKYREEMRIPCSLQRRRLKQADLAVRDRPRTGSLG